MATVIILIVVGVVCFVCGAWGGIRFCRNQQRDNLKAKEFWFEKKCYRIEQIGELKEQ